MTIKQLKEIISNLPDETPVYLDTEDVYLAETVTLEYHADGRTTLLISDMV